MIKPSAPPPASTSKSSSSRRVYLDLHVRVEPDWREDRRILGEIDRDLMVPLGVAEESKLDEEDEFED